MRGAQYGDVCDLVQPSKISIGIQGGVDRIEAVHDPTYESIV